MVSVASCSRQRQAPRLDECIIQGALGVECVTHHWLVGVAVASFITRTKLLYTLSPVSTGIGDRPPANIPLRYVTRPTRSTELCIPPGSLN